MHNVITFNEVLESADRLTLVEQETLMDVLKRRIIEQRRLQIAKEIQAAQSEFDQNACRTATPSELMKEILD